MKHAIAILMMMMFAIPVLAADPAEDAKFVAAAHDYVEELLKTHPENATQLGDHRYDDRLDDYSKAGVDHDLKFNRDTLASLATIKRDRLSAVNSVDLRILENALQSQIYSLETLRAWEWNPLAYNVGGAIYGVAARDFAPPEQRLGSIIGRLNQVPDVVAAAKANLKNPPKIHVETAITQNQGTISLIRTGLAELAHQAPQLEPQLETAQKTAVESLVGYGNWLKDDLLPRANGDFRIGDEKFRKKLRYSLDSDLTKEEILASAEADLKKTQDAMYEIALSLFKHYFPSDANTSDRKHVIKAVLDKLADQHPTNETIIGLAEKALASTTAFVRKQELVNVPNERLQVTPMPEFNRGVAVASCNSPGALEKNGKTFFYISPTPADWPAKRVESFFREYNDYMLQDLTIHEAMPGHYLQLAHSNKFKAPTVIRAIYGNGAFVEGWATYAEQFMAEAGYGGPQVRMQQLKMRLRLLINAIIDQKIHTAGMTEKEAMDLMMNEGFQEEGEAAGKWRRANLTSGQLSTYYVGNIEMNNIRAAWVKKHGRGEMRKLHNQMLSYGSPAAKYVREMMGL
jgi:uncharacterized protein (DUF885 family)